MYIFFNKELTVYGRCAIIKKNNKSETYIDCTGEDIEEFERMVKNSNASELA